MYLSLPAPVMRVLKILEEQGFEAYVVGGCVRDSIMGKTPKDWDITTNALPTQTEACFCRRKIAVHRTGFAHGTVTVVVDGMPLEVTTYRIDGEYKDHRRPQNVTFTDSLYSDLARRDFTINAMAYHPRTGLCDFFGGVSDIEKKLVRCVGDADKRFSEDALRILRALRFASELGFEIEAETAKSIHNNKHLLRGISAERISAEFSGLITGMGAPGVLEEFLDVVYVFIPEIAPEDAQAKTHRGSLKVTLAAIGHSRPVLALRLAILFYGAAAGGDNCRCGPLCAQAASSRLRQLRYDRATIQATAELIRHFGCEIGPEPEQVKRWLGRLGEERLGLLLDMKKAVLAAQGLGHTKQVLKIDKAIKIMTEVLSQNQCFCRGDLKVKGSDLIRLGINEGPMIGKLLDRLLELVITGEAKNEKAELLKLAKRMADDLTK